MIRRVYVASAFGNKGAVRAAQVNLRACGIAITHDWTGEDENGRTGDERIRYLIACALDDVKGVERADALIALNHVDGVGLWWECGIALARGIPIVIVGEGKWTAFFELPNVYRVEDMVEALNLIAVLNAPGNACAR